MSYIRPQLGDDIEIEIEPETMTTPARDQAAEQSAFAQTGTSIANSITAPLTSLFSVFGAPAARNTAVAKKPSLLPLAVGAALVAMFIMNKKKRSK